MKDGRKKGNDFENAVCRALSQWYGTRSKRLSGLPFRRRSTSIMPVEGHWQGEGDILHRPDVSFPFAVECKKHEGWELDGGYYEAKWPVWDWWEQAKAQARRAKLKPLLIFTRNRRPVYVLLEESAATWLKLKPRSGLVSLLWRPSGESAVLARLDDLVQSRSPAP